MDSDDEYPRAWDTAYDALVEEVAHTVKEEERAAAVVPRPIQHRRTIPCDHIRLTSGYG